jgi:hypothetical protein
LLCSETPEAVIGREIIVLNSGIVRTGFILTENDSRENSRLEIESELPYIESACCCVEENAEQTVRYLIHLSSMNCHCFSDS